MALHLALPALCSNRWPGVLRHLTVAGLACCLGPLTAEAQPPLGSQNVPQYGSAQSPVTGQMTNNPVPTGNIPVQPGQNGPTGQNGTAGQNGSTGQNGPTGQPAAEHPLVGAIRLAEESLAAANRMPEYRVLFTKKELVNNQMFASQIDMKFRLAPMAVYLNFVNPEHAGREVMFVQGQNNDLMLAHDTGLRALVGTVQLDPNGATALAEARHPITQIGIANLAEGVLIQWRKESTFGESDVKYYPEAKLGEQPVIVIENTHPTPRREFPFQTTRLWLDKQTRLPVRVQQYEFARTPGGPPVLVEEYTYTNLMPNPGFTNSDFDPRNPNYHF